MAGWAEGFCSEPQAEINRTKLVASCRFLRRSVEKYRIGYTRSHGTAGFFGRGFDSRRPLCLGPDTKVIPCYELGSTSARKVFERLRRFLLHIEQRWSVFHQPDEFVLVPILTSRYSAATARVTFAPGQALHFPRS